MLKVETAPGPAGPEIEALAEGVMRTLTGRQRRTVSGAWMRRPEHVWPQVVHANSSPAQVLDGAAPLGGHPKPAVTPGRYGCLGNAKLLGQGGPAVGVDEVLKFVHAGEFSLTEPIAQGPCSGKLDPHCLGRSYTGSMNRSWQLVAKARMATLGISQQHLANKLGPSKATISNWFTGRHQAPLKYLGKIADMLDMTLAELLSEDDSLARNKVELDTLRLLRDLPPDQVQAAGAMIAALLQTLKNLPPKEK